MCGTSSVSIVEDTDTIDKAGITLAHELGHAFGMVHDPGIGFVMDANFFASLPYPTAFSAGSQTGLTTWLFTTYGTATAACLQDVPAVADWTLRRCGDGRTEGPEDCDPGAGTADSCCGPTCALAAGCACANSQPCCASGTLRAPGFTCRPSRDAVCAVAETCDGTQAECPFDRVASPGTACIDSPPDGLSPQAAECLAGRCVLSEINQCRDVNYPTEAASFGCPTTACNQLTCSSTPGACDFSWPGLPPLDGTSCGVGKQCSQGQCLASSSLAQYSWDVGAWGSCTAGNQTRPVVCRDETGALAPDASCDPTTKPLDARTCTGG
jgi:disintegrin/ADAM-TS-like cysteine-rich domain containing protein